MCDLLYVQTWVFTWYFFIRENLPNQSVSRLLARPLISHNNILIPIVPTYINIIY